MGPRLLLIVIFGGIYGALFHLWLGRRVRQLVAYVIAATVGFGLGQVIGDVAGLDIGMIGRLHVLVGTLASGTLLFVARWLKL